VAITRTQCGGGLKLARTYLGPYRIKRALRHDRYIVEKVGQAEGPRMISTVIDHMSGVARLEVMMEENIDI